MANTTTKKAYGGMQASPVKKAEPSKSVGMSSQGPSYKGQLGGNHQSFAEPMNSVNAKISGIGGTHNDIGEQSGFITDGYLDKNGMPYGEAAKLNFLPPGMDISNQVNCEIHDMPMRTYKGGISYPDDGWSPAPRDVQE